MMDEFSRSDKDGWDTIHLIIQALSQLYRVIQLEDANKKTPVDLGRAKSAPPQFHLDPMNLIFKIHDSVSQINTNIKYVNRFQLLVKQEMDEQLRSLLYVVKDANSSDVSRIYQIEKRLVDISNGLLDLKMRISVLPGRRKKQKESQDAFLRDDYELNCGKEIVCLPSIHANEDLKRLAVFRHVRGELGKLSYERKICLLSFAVFQENKEVSRTMLMYWWIGEGILPVLNAESTAKDILKEFTEKNLVEPCEDKRKMEPSSYKMSPFVHSSVVLLSKEIGLFDMYHEGQKPRMKKSAVNKVCLVKGSSSLPKARTKNMASADIETVFNISESYPDFIFKWFSTMKVLKVLYLGKWERTQLEIEVDNYGLMKNLSSLKDLRFLSLRGILTIMKFSAFACNLPELIILDLRECDNLEELPEEIDYLKNLVYLDLTGCDALYRMPMRLSWLSKLEVIKGFVVADTREVACKLSHLKHLKKLRKLSVTVDRKDFSLQDLLKAIEGFSALEKLKVQWKIVKRLSKKQSMDNSIRLVRSLTFNEVSLPPTIRKLDLQRFPDRELPECLQPQNLGDLEKLHLGSSRRLKVLSDSLPEKPSKCNVKVLRLTCLQKLKVDWIELKEFYFPNLQFLEMYECPRVTFCPCDQDGIWSADKDEST